MRALMREHSQLEPLDQAVRRYADLEDAQKQARALLDEPDMAEMAKEELTELERRLAETRREIQLLLLPKDPNAERNVVMEIRSGAGGEEAALFGAMLMRMYMRYAERHGWKTEMLEASMTELGGVKEAVYRHHGGGRVQPPEIRERRAPRSAHPGDGEQRQAAMTPPPRRSPCCPRRRRLTLKSTPTTCASTSTARPATAGNTSTRRTVAVRITHIPSGIGR